MLHASLVGTHLWWAPTISLQAQSDEGLALVVAAMKQVEIRNPLISDHLAACEAPNWNDLP
jgi:hypothetical protein